MATIEPTAEQRAVADAIYDTWKQLNELRAKAEELDLIVRFYQHPIHVATYFLDVYTKSNHLRRSS